MGITAETLELRAYHEAGHAVIAYLSGFSCNYLEITQRSPITNRDCYDLGHHTSLIRAMEKYKETPEIFDDIPEELKADCQKTAVKTIIVLLAGQAAELLFKNNGRHVMNPSMDLTGEDIRPADNLDYFLTVVKQGQHPVNNLKIVFKQVLEILHIKEVWAAVTSIAEKISDGKRLEKKDLEKILIETGCLQALYKLRQGKNGNSASAPERQNNTSDDNESEDNSGSKGFTREELLRLKEQIKSRPTFNRNVISKKEGMARIVAFAKGHKFVNFKIGMVDHLDQLRNIDKERYVAFDVKDHAVARDILMYFICMGMEVSPGSTQNKSAASIFVVKDELI